MDRPESRDDRGSRHSALALLARLYWMLLGNAALGISAAAIARSPQAPSVADAVFWATVLSLIGVRYWDVAHFAGATADGEPATLAHWKRYAAAVAGIGLAVWLAATGVARLWP